MAQTVQRGSAQLTPIRFAAVPGWANDDQRGAFTAFLATCERLLARRSVAPTGRDARPDRRALIPICQQAQSLGASPSRAAAQGFFERHFVPHRVGNGPATGLLTGYYEPELDAVRFPTPGFSEPIYARPNDLVLLSGRSRPAGLSPSLGAARQTASGLVPYYTREQIDRGALKGRGLEIFYLRDRIDSFFLHIQGSGLLRLPDGSRTRVNYSAKNGHAYASVGKVMIQRGYITAAGMSLQSMKQWLRDNGAYGQEILWNNPSYVFFRELTGEEAVAGPLGAEGIPLTPGRSLAVDPAFHSLGLPIYVDAPEIRHHGEAAFRRLMIAQDVGSAIKGPQRGDIYWGSGPAAGELAGVTKHRGQFIVLLPRASASAAAAD